MSPVTAFSGEVALDLFPYGCWAQEAVINTGLIDRRKACVMTALCDEEGTWESRMTKGESRGEARGWVRGRGGLPGGGGIPGQARGHSRWKVVGQRLGR